ncbi:MAG: prepilin-type N-terminal cleavage/methylation domain-containing protein [Fusobacterium sp.]|nr:prepilin-type N-terminal cleavage/methylation domain-containing protein [Fusobacterium sp.]
MNKRNVLTWTGGGGSLLSRPTESGATHYDPSAWTKPRAFTMAEILLSLTIIGVVAAITLPSLTGNINERTWNTQRKALYARFSQAIALMPALNGYGTLDDTTDTAAETFVTAGLSKVLKINNVCDNEHVWDCGLASKINTLDARNIDLPVKIQNLNAGLPATSVPNTNAAAFETVNGESILAFYNPNCVSAGVVVTGVDAAGNEGEYVKQHVCANFVFDLNGAKGPNTVGKDIGIMSVIYPTDSNVVMPIMGHELNTSYTQQNAAKECANQDSDSRLPNVNELLGMYYNGDLIGWGVDGATGKYWSSTVTDSTHAYAFGYGTGRKYEMPKDTRHKVQCVKR